MSKAVNETWNAERYQREAMRLGWEATHGEYAGYWKARMAARFAFCSLSTSPLAAFYGRSAATRAYERDVTGARHQAILAARLAGIAVRCEALGL